MSLSVESIKNIPKPLLFSIVATAFSLLGGMVVIFFLILPVRARNAASTQEVLGLEATLATMKADIKQTDELVTRTAKLCAERDDWVRTGTLKPEQLSNSMRLGAKALMTPIAQRTGFKLENVKEYPAILLRLPASVPRDIYARQPIEFVGQGTFDQIVGFIRETEEKYPLTILSGLVILGQPFRQDQAPEHKAVITFEWPVKHEWLPSGPTGQK